MMKRTDDKINKAISHYMGFGDFIFRKSDEEILDVKASNLDEFLEVIQDPDKVPVESLVYHATRNHFSLWLAAQGEIELANIV